MAKLILKGFRALKELLSPRRFESALKREITVATKKNALAAEGAIKRAIYAGEFEKNSFITTDIKGSDRPLVRHGELAKSIIGRALAWNIAVIGVLKSKRIKDPDTGQTRDLLSIAQILHSGVPSITVTDKMRRFFFVMADKYRRGETKEKWHPLSPKTKELHIPPRPFLTAAIKPEMLRKYEDEWNDAVQRAMGGK